MCTAQLIGDLCWDTGVSKRSQLTHCIHPEWYTVNMEMLLLCSDYDYNILHNECKFSQMEACVIAVQNFLQY